MRNLTTKITGSVTFYDEHTGEVQSRSINFKSSSDTAWVDIVDEATEIARAELIRSFVPWAGVPDWTYETDNLEEA